IPAVAWASFSVKGTPCSGPHPSPRARASSASWARLRACPASMVMMAFRAGLCVAICAKCASSTSVAETWPVRMAAANCVVLEKTMSIVIAPFYNDFSHAIFSLPLFPQRLLRKPLSGACLRLGSLFCAVPRWCVRLEGAEKVAGDCCYFVNGSKECSFVGFRWLVEAAHLSHELQRGRTNLFLGHRRFEVEECFDVSTHKRSVLRNLPFCGQAIISIRFLLRRGEF